NRARKFAKGAVRPRSRSHHDSLRRTSSSETENPRIVVTNSRNESPAGPTSLLRTSASIAWLICCNSPCAAEPKFTIEPVSVMSSSAMRLRIASARGAGAFSSGITSAAGSGSTTAVTSSTAARARAASSRTLDMVTLHCGWGWVRQTHTLALQAVAQDRDLDVEVGPVVFQKRGGAAGEGRFEVVEQSLVVGARGGGVRPRPEVGELDRRVARAHQIDAEPAARRRQVAGVLLHRAEERAGSDGEAFDAGEDRPVAGAFGGRAHFGEVALALRDDARHAVLLERVESRHALVAQGVGAESEMVQRRADAAEKERAD